MGILTRSTVRDTRPVDALRSCRAAFIGVAWLSVFINILMLTGSVFMMEVYDRILPSRSVPTLVGLCVIAFLLYAFLGVFDMLRGRILTRAGDNFDARLSPQLFGIMVTTPLRGGRAGVAQPMRDLDKIRSFLAGNGPLALFDLPWLPFYLALCFAFHFWIGVAASAGAAFLVVLTLCTEAFTRKPASEAAGHAAVRAALTESGRRNAEVLHAMGMVGTMRQRWCTANQRFLRSQRAAADVAGGIGATSKVFRMLLQSAVLAVGAYLVIAGEATPGIIIASSILSGRALAPVDLAIANWRGFVDARQGFTRLRTLMEEFPEQSGTLPLPAPKEGISVEGVSVAPPGHERPVVHDVSLQLRAGSGLGIIGPSASGKSSLARALVGVWAPSRGKVRIDGAALDQWSSEALGRHVGYLPQDVELFDGTVAENIARFDPEADPEAIIAAARTAGVHDLILRLPEGYGTRIGEAGAALSGGQRQRVALARALYRDPFLVVLDEPNSNLDAEGEQALTQAILSVRKRGGIVVVVAHRPSALAGVDYVLHMANGGATAFGPKEKILNEVLQRRSSPSLKVVSEGGNP